MWGTEYAEIKHKVIYKVRNSNEKEVANQLICKSYSYRHPVALC